MKEFTDLQGIVGGLYARAQGEPEEVARAIYDHYKPLSMEDEIPSTAAGRILSLADKYDTLRGMLQGRHDAYRIERSIRPSPRRPGCRADYRGGPSESRLRRLSELPNSCATASNTTSAMFAASPTTKSAPAWRPVGPISSIWKSRLLRVKAFAPRPTSNPSPPASNASKTS